MPELPEVETVMRGMAAWLEGARITRITLSGVPLRRPYPERFAERLAGRQIMGFRRRGKYILMRLDDGMSVIWHLGMSGRVLRLEGDSLSPHLHFRLESDKGALGLIDPRRFGLLDLTETAREMDHPLLAPLGPEPLEKSFTAPALAGALAKRPGPLKTVLLDQRLIAGLGNIYVSESLFRARLHPARAASSLSPAETTSLTRAIKATLREAIAAGGTSLRDFVHTDGTLGYFQHRFRVYGREGRPCSACPGPGCCPGVQRVVQAGRSTFFCPRRQR